MKYRSQHYHRRMMDIKLMMKEFVACSVWVLPDERDR